MAEITEAGATLTRVAAEATADAPLDDLRFDDGVIDLDRITEFAEPLEDAEAVLADAAAVVEEVDVPWLLPPLADRVDAFADEVDDALPQAEIARQGVALAPALFGADEVRRYFVAFVTPAEQRGLGGFMGNFAVLTADRGDVSLARSAAIAAMQRPLRERGVEVTGPDDYVARYGGFDPAEFPGDVTLSPDFPTVAAVLRELYPASGGQDIDGVILVDPFALAGVPDVHRPDRGHRVRHPVDQRERGRHPPARQYLTFDERDERKDFLEEASRRTFEELTTGDLPGAQRVTEVLGPMVDQGRLLVHSFVQGEQAFFEQIGIDGAFPRAGGGDLLAVTTQNNAHNKGDSYLQRRIDYRATVDLETGGVDATATVTLVNSAPSGGAPDVLIGSSPSAGTTNPVELPLGTNRMYLSLYTPLALDDADIDGRPLLVGSQRELGVNVYARFIEVAPGSTATLTFRLSGSLDLREGYQLTVAGQPTINPDEVTVEVAVTGGEIAARRGLEDRADRVTARWHDVEDHVLEAALSR